MLNMKLSTTFLCLCFAFAFAKVAEKKILPSLTICKRHIANLSECFKENILILLPLMKDGVPEMNIHPIDPFLVEKLHIELPEVKSVSLKGDLTNLTLRGLSTANIGNVTCTLINNSIDVHIVFTIPEVTMTSNLSGTGKFFLVTLNTHGDFTGVYQNISVVMHWSSAPYIKNGKQHLQWSAELKKLDFDKLRIYINNVYGVNAEITESVNEILNENLDELYRQFSPIIRQTICSVVEVTVNNVYEVFPFDVLFPLN